MRESLLSRVAPRFAIALGILLLASTIATFALAATGARELEETVFTTRNGNATSAYALPQARWDVASVRVEYSFPRGSGSVGIVQCAEYPAVIEGAGPTTRGLSSGQRGFVGKTGFDKSSGPAPDAPGCTSYYVVAVWSFGAEGPEANRPSMRVRLYSAFLAPDFGLPLAALGVAGAGLAIAGSVAWGRRASREALVDAGEGTAETLLVAIDLAGAWLERTRRYLVIGGVLGVLLWYPIVLTWGWNFVLRSGGSGIGGLVPFLALLLVIALTFVWLRELLRIDRDLAFWRSKLARLREREKSLLEAPPPGSG